MLKVLQLFAALTILMALFSPICYSVHAFSIYNFYEYLNLLYTFPYLFHLQLYLGALLETISPCLISVPLLLT